MASSPPYIVVWLRRYHKIKCIATLFRNHSTSCAKVSFILNLFGGVMQRSYRMKDYPDSVCNACSSVKHKYEEISGYQLYKCHECGLINAYKPHGNDIGTVLYEKDFYFKPENDSETASYYSNYIKQTKNIRKFNNIIRELKKFSNGGKLLDIGCAMGTFLEIARYYWDVEGLEISSYASNYTRNNLKITVFNGTIEEAKYPDDSFDVVTCIDVLEHVDDPNLMINEIARIIKPDGIAFFETLITDSPTVNRNIKKWKLMIPPVHLFYFSKKSLQLIMEKNGFEILKMNIGYHDNRPFGKIVEIILAYLKYIVKNWIIAICSLRLPFLKKYLCRKIIYWQKFTDPTTMDYQKTPTLNDIINIYVTPKN